MNNAVEHTAPGNADRPDYGFHLNGGPRLAPPALQRRADAPSSCPTAFRPPQRRARRPPAAGLHALDLERCAVVTGQAGQNAATSSRFSALARCGGPISRVIVTQHPEIARPLIRQDRQCPAPICQRQHCSALAAMGVIAKSHYNSARPMRLNAAGTRSMLIFIAFLDISLPAQGRERPG